MALNKFNKLKNIKLTRELPVAVFYHILHIPQIAHGIKHLYLAPPEISAAFEVGRPDLYWLVARTWHALKTIPNICYEDMCRATATVVSSVWNLDSGTKSYRQMLSLCRALQVHMRITQKGGTADIELDGIACVSMSPRDKMLLACAAVWGPETRWIDAMPMCVPGPLAVFRNLFLT